MLRLVVVPAASLAVGAPIGLSKVYAAEKETSDSDVTKESVKYKPSQVSQIQIILCKSNTNYPMQVKYKLSYASQIQTILCKSNTNYPMQVKIQTIPGKLTKNHPK